MKVVKGNDTELSISVVSHQQGRLVRQLLLSLDVYRPPLNFEVILTLNLSEPSPVEELNVSYPVIVITNNAPCGFAKNHNQAFRFARGKYFSILNPDIVFIEQVYTELIEKLEDYKAGIIAPQIVDRLGGTQDNFRKLPTPLCAIARYFGSNQANDLVPINENGLAHPDWIAGMFLLMRTELFKRLGGFNERYFLYYEDVDLGIRCRLAGYPLIVDTHKKVVHEAQRESHKRFLYLLRHLKSMISFFLSETFWEARRNRVYKLK